MSEKFSRPPSEEQGSDASAFIQGYNTLPAELKEHVFELACAFLAPPSSSSTSHPLYDVPACLNLSLVSKELNERVRPAVYRQISITRPSALYALQQTLEAHPEWGKLIKNLHIGNTSALPTHWWPLSDAFPDQGGQGRDHPEHSQSYTWLASSLNRDRLPSGCGDRQAWALGRPASGRRDAAICEALRMAQRYLEVDLIHDGLDDRPLQIDAIYEAQAALDLYLEKVRALEEAEPELKQDAGVREPTGTYTHCYPPLVIAPIIEQPSRAKRPVPKGALVLSRAQLLRHLARPGSTTDRFDHPLTVARSGYEISVTQPLGKGHPGYREGGAAEYDIFDSGFYVDDTDWADQRELQFADMWEVKSGSGMALNGAVLNTATLGLCQELAKAVMKLTPSVENLSLTGALQRSLCWTLFKQENVRRVTLGPTPPWWDVVTEMDMKDLKLVEELRICGTPLYEPDRGLIATMRKLRILEWSMGEEYPPALVGVDEDVQALINTPVPAHDSSHADSQGVQDHSAGDEAQQRRDGDDGQSDEIAASPARSNTPPLAVVRLHTTDVDRVLAAAPTPEVREAWLQGRAVEGTPRRLQLVAKDIESRSNRAAPHLDDTEPAWDVMYQEGRDWWLDGAV